MRRERLGYALAASVFLHTLILWVPLGHPVGAAPDSRPALNAHLVMRPHRVPETIVVQHDKAPADSSRTADSPLPATGAKEPEQAVTSALVPRYFRSGEVDVRAEPVSPPPLVIPEAAYLSRIRGMVRLRVYVTETGAVAAAEIIEALPPGLYEQAALDAVRATRFSPAILAGHPVRNVKELEIRLDPYETIAQP